MRLALGIEYDGASFHGWQRQQTVISVQQHVEEALSEIANEPIKVVCAGRTDAGVHATCQVVHFETQSQRPDKAWTIGINRYLPDSISAKWVTHIGEDFHARFSATARRYRYIIYNNRMRNSILAKGVTHIHDQLDHNLMHQAAQYLVGRHDFSAFRAVNCQANTPTRDLQHIRVERFGDYIVIDVKANAFLHHMVRNITGSLLVIGKKEKSPDWIQTLLVGKDRTKAAATAKPYGLYLVDVTYPEQFDLPTHPIGPLFLPD
ncbi:tRNA pseudouridine(38-40) synthase TruA [Paraglaciecola sp.]|uniref:tRNA pseudouridine(38-40) synthase TruA n=1 Tax=Paraglaciecola sp. TaxID=1920173 RepID=UPI003EF310A9